MRRIRAVGVAVIVCSSASSPSHGQNPPAPAPSGSASAVAAGWRDAIKGAALVHGLFTFYHRRDNALFLELAPSELERQFGMLTKVARGPAGIAGPGTRLSYDMNDEDPANEVALLRFHRAGDRVELQRIVTRMVADSPSTIREAVEAGSANSVLASFRIEGEDPATHGLLINVSAFFASDYESLVPSIKEAYDGKNIIFDREQSYVAAVQGGGPRAVDIDAELRFRAPDFVQNGVGAIADPRFIPVRTRISLFALPDTPMQTRFADHRIGYFTVSRWDYARSRYATYVTRWRLEPAERVGDLVRPKQQIVFWIDSSVPPKFRLYVKQGVEAWNRAFEAAGWSDVVTTRELTEGDSTWSGVEFGRVVVRWNPSFANAGGGAAEYPDPRTGEILQADISIGSFRGGSAQQYALFVGDSAAQATLGARRTHPTLLEFEGERIRQTIMHEVGHTLGLRHNRKASSVVPYDSLSSPEYVRRNGIVPSVMDAAPMNLARDPAKQGQFYDDRVGEYDIWAIRYGYSRAEGPALQAIVHEANPAHVYSGATAESPSAADPAATAFDLGDDLLRFVADRLAIQESVTSRLVRVVTGVGVDYIQLRGLVDGRFQLRQDLVRSAMKMIGGVVTSPSRYSVVDGPVPLVPVTAARQRDALRLVLREGLSPTAFTIPPDLLNRLLPYPFYHWDMRNAAPVDYPIHQRVRDAQAALLRDLLHPTRLQRIIDNQSRQAASIDAFTVAELLHTVTRSVWDSHATTSAVHRELQAAYVAELARLALNAPGWTSNGRQIIPPQDARSLSRLELQDIDSRIARDLERPSPAREVHAHLLAMRHEINRVLREQ